MKKLKLISVLVVFMFPCVSLFSKGKHEEQVVVNSSPTFGVIAEIEQGNILGFNNNGVNTFMGIPYGVSNRW